MSNDLRSWFVTFPNGMIPLVEIGGVTDWYQRHWLQRTRFAFVGLDYDCQTLDTYFYTYYLEITYDIM